MVGEDVSKGDPMLCTRHIGSSPTQRRERGRRGLIDRPVNTQTRAMNISRILIVGGGIGGLTAALALQHFGYRVAIFEQAQELREIGAGVTITPNAMHALHFLGVGERVAKEAGSTEAYLIRHFHTGEVMRVRANGT